MTVSDKITTNETADLLETLKRHRFFLRLTVRDLTDEHAGRRTTASELCLGGLIKHVALAERRWAEFIVDGPSAMRPQEGGSHEWSSAFTMGEGETLAALLEQYDVVAANGRCCGHPARSGRRPAASRGSLV